MGPAPFPGKLRAPAPPCHGQGYRPRPQVYRGRSGRQARAEAVRQQLRDIALGDKPTVLFVSHDLGGGALQHVQDLSAALAAQAAFLLLTPVREAGRVRLVCLDSEGHCRDGLVFAVAGQRDTLLELLRGLGIGRVHFHHTFGLPPELLALAADLDCDYDVTIHDYFLVNANTTLTDGKGRFVDEDAPDFERRCAANRRVHGPFELQQWRSQQQAWLAGASRVIFPSGDCARRFRRFYRLDNSRVAWHPDFALSRPYPQPRWSYDGSRPLRVLVLGAMNREKGADMLDSVARALAPVQVEFHLLGYAYRRLDDSVTCHGPYTVDDCMERIRAIDPDLAWFPSQCPETYSYTLSAALNCALPVVVPDIGAFAERVAGRSHSVVRPWNSSLQQWCEFWRTLVRDRQLPPGADSDPAPATGIDRDFYSRDYLQGVVAVRGELDPALLQRLDRNMSLVADGSGLPERVLRALWRFSRHRAGARLLALVPLRVQRAVKRFLSRRPLHDIVGD